MTFVVALVAFVLGLGLGLAAFLLRGRYGRERPRPVKRILLPFTGTSISRRAFEAAVRLARAENATIMPAFLARVPRQLPLDSELPAQCTQAMPLLEALEQKAETLGIPVDARIGRGRTYRDALRRLLEEEHFDRVIVSASSNGKAGIDHDDLEWLLDQVPAEILILRPAPDDERRIAAEPVSGHF